jgi:Putative Actinobacterial Holin-X, holin superfamily III
MDQPTSSSTETANGSEQRSISALLQQLTEQTTRLAQQEIELAKAEMTAKGKRIGIGVGAFSGAGLLALLALGALTAAAILGLATAVAAWLAALIVAVVYLAIAGAMALAGRSKVRAATPPLPEQTVESVKEDLQETKQKAKEGRA